MSGAEVATNVAIIVSSFYRAFKALEILVDNGEHNVQLDLNAAKSRLLMALKEGSQRINDEYRNDVLRAGPPFSRGDGVAIASLETVYMQIRASILDIIDNAVAGTVSLRLLNYQEIQSAASKATRDTVTTLAQLFLRTSHQAPIPTSLKHDHPWNIQWSEGTITDPNILIQSLPCCGLVKTGYSGTLMKGSGQHGIGNVFSKSRLVYAGGWRRNKFHGYGTIPVKDGFGYDGDFDNGKKHGCGVWTMGPGATYEGEMQNGHRHGYGLQTFRDGAIYKGDWKNNQMHGFGILLLPLLRYEGGFELGKVHGYAVCTSNEGWYYSGQYKVGQRDGSGAEVSQSGSRYDGDWKEMKWHGFGTLVLPSGETYEGNLEGGQRHGYGVATWPDGRRYTGEWKNDHPIAME